MIELKFETWQLTPESLLLTTAPMVLKCNHVSESPGKCVKHRLLGPIPQSFWINRFCGFWIFISNKLMLPLKGPHFENHCPVPKGLSHRWWNRERKRSQQEWPLEKEKISVKKVGKELRKKGMKYPVIGVKLKSYGNILGPFAPWVGKESSSDLKQPKSIQTSFEHSINLVAKRCSHVQDVPTLTTTINLTHLQSNPRILWTRNKTFHAVVRNTVLKKEISLKWWIYHCLDFIQNVNDSL